MARRHGTSTAKHCQKTVSKYVLEPLVRDEVIAHNPLKSFRPRLPECRMTNKAPGGQALTPEERGRVLEYLLANKFGVRVCPHAGGVGLCEAVRHFAMSDYLAVSGQWDDRVIEYVDNQHEYFVHPTEIVNGRYKAPTAPGSGVDMKLEAAERCLYKG